MELNMQCILVRSEKTESFPPDTGKNIRSITAEGIQKWEDVSGLTQFPVLTLSLAANPERAKKIDIFGN